MSFDLTALDACHPHVSIESTKDVKHLNLLAYFDCQVSGSHVAATQPMVHNVPGLIGVYDLYESIDKRVMDDKHSLLDYWLMCVRYLHTSCESSKRLFMLAEGRLISRII